MSKKNLDLLLFFVFYIIAYFVGFISIYFIEANSIMKLFIFDIIATIVIWFFSLVIKNSSLYDPYWSLTPLVMLGYLVVIHFPTNLYLGLFIITLGAWSLRLTFNWMKTFGGRKWIDWRYKKYQSENNFIVWHIINFFGIMLMPTILVFVAFIPVYFLFTTISVFSILGSAIVTLGVLLEYLADNEMHRFLLSDEKKEVCRVGLWKYSRHPNYLGEILVWFGTYLALVLSDASKWYFGIGFVLILCLFEFISIPLAEHHHLQRRVEYASYQKETSRLLILPSKNI